MQTLLYPFSLGNVGVDFQDPHGATARIAVENLMTGNHQSLAVAFAVHQLPFPLAKAAQHFILVRLPFFKLGPKQLIRNAAQRLRFRIAVELLGPSGPQDNATLQIPHQHRS